VRRSAPILIAVAVALTGAGPANGRTVLGPLPETDATDVRPDRLLYAYDGDYGYSGVFDRRPGGRERRLRQFDSLYALRPSPAGDALERELSVTGSSALTAVSVSTGAVFYEGAADFTSPGPGAVAVARRGGPARRLVQCSTYPVGPVRVDGDVVAYIGAGCRDQIGVRDTRTGRTLVLRPPAGRGFADLQLAGRYVAASEVDRSGEARFGLYDWRRGRRVRSLPQGEEFGLSASAAATTSCGPGEIAWYELPVRVRRTLPGAVCDERVLVAGRRALWARALPGGDPADPVAEYVVTNLATGATHRILDSRTPGGARFPVYFDGRELGYSTPGCHGGEEIVVDTPAELKRMGPYVPGPCEVSLAHLPRVARVSRLAEFTIRLECATGCSGFVRLRDAAQQPVLLRSGDHDAYAAEAGETTRVTIALADHEAERLKQAGRLEVELVFQVFQPNGSDTTRTAPLTLMAPE
jgi:hypothetical protein